jgi:hypothetical protein
MNKRGQAMIESLFVGIILIVGLSFLLRSFSKAHKRMLLDEFIEETLVCLIQNKSTCVSSFQQKLRDQGFSNISVLTHKRQNTWTLHLKATSSLNEKIEKESELEYETHLQI